MTKFLQKFSSLQKDIFSFVIIFVVSLVNLSHLRPSLVILDILGTFSSQSKNGFILLKVTCCFHRCV